MNWLPFAIAAAGLLVVAGVVAKVVLHTKLQNIDGLNGATRRDKTQEGTILASLGGDADEKKEGPSGVKK